MFMWIFSLLWYLFLLSLLLVALFALLFFVHLLRVNDFPNRRSCTSKVKLTGKTAIVTGSNRGIGYETAKDLAARGAKVIMACRNMEKAELAKSKIIAETGNKEVFTMQCDLSDLESVQNFCKNVLAKESALHILVNNAGLTKQNFDITVGANHVGHFLLTYLLMDTMKKSAPARIVNVSSAASDDCHEMGNGIKLPQMKQYWCSKLANVLHAKELARILRGTRVTTYSLHPGFIYDGMPSTVSENRGIDKSSPLMVFVGYLVGYLLNAFKFLSLNAVQGAQTTIFCAVDESVASESGKYYDNCKVKEPNKLAVDADLARRLWNVTLELVEDYTKIASE